MSTRITPLASASVLVLSSLFFSACTAQSTRDEGDDPSTLSTSTDDALSALGKQLVGDYKSKAAYPLFSLNKDGSYAWDTGIRCIRNPCNSGDAGTFTIYTGSYGSKYVNLLSKDWKVSRWFFIDSLKPVTLVGVFGTTGTFTKIVATPPVPACTINSDCANGEQCIASVCTPKPLCVQVPVGENKFVAKNFPAGSFAEADAWGAATSKGGGYGISVYTCAETAAGFGCTEEYMPVCALTTNWNASKTFGNNCEMRKAVIAEAGTYGEATSIIAKGKCTTGSPHCGTYTLTPEGSTSSAYYVHSFDSTFEASAWIQLNPQAVSSAVLDGRCEAHGICTKEYNPVCGGVRSDVAKTFGNRCMLEAAVRIDSAASSFSKGYYTPGACKP